MYFSAGFVGQHWGQEIVGRLGETWWGRLTKAFVTLSQTQQIRPISTLSQIRPISSRDRPLLRRGPINYPPGRPGLLGSSLGLVCPSSTPDWQSRRGQWLTNNNDGPCQARRTITLWLLFVHSYIAHPCQLISFLF